MAEAALAMRYVMLREEEPSFVIKDPIYVKECVMICFDTVLHTGALHWKNFE